METTTDTQQGTLRFLRLLHKREATTDNYSPKYTTWAEATTNPFKALHELLRCLKAGYNAWIERQENGDQFYPIRMKNPKLERQESWKFVDAKITTREQLLSDQHFFNDITRKLTLQDHQGFPKDDQQLYKFYKPKGGIPNYITKPLIRKVYVVCFNTEEPTPPIWVRVIVIIQAKWSACRLKRQNAAEAV